MVVLEADPEEEGWFSIVSVNGMTKDEANKVLPRITPEEGRELELKGNLFLEISVGTDIFWPSDELPDMDGKPYVKLTGHVWFEEYDSIECGTEYDSGFKIDSEELLED